MNIHCPRLISINILSVAEGECFKELSYDASQEPNIVIVQGNIGGDYYSEGQGNKYTVQNNFK